MMAGYQKSRFVDLIEAEFDELSCGICFGVFREPIETKCCRKTYCKSCITNWLKRGNYCPNDGKKLNINDLIDSSKIVLNLLANLKIRCEFSDNGCPKVLQLNSLEKHLKECNYNGCKSCGETIGNANDHSCERSLKMRVWRLFNDNQILCQTVNQLNIKIHKMEAVLRKHRIVVCFKCAEEGHLSSNCRKRSRSLSRNRFKETNG